MKQCSKLFAQVLSAMLPLACVGLVGACFYQMMFAGFSLPDFVERGVLVSLTATVVLVVHRLLLYRLPPAYLLCLWLVVLFQLAGVQLPQMVPSGYGLGSQLPTVTVQGEASDAPTSPDVVGQGAQVRPTQPAQDVTLSYRDGQTQTVSYAARVAQMVYGVWCGGAVLLLLWFFGNYFYFVWHITGQRVQALGDNPAQLCLLCAQAKQALGVVRQVPLCLTAQDGPLLLGVVCPRIVLPASVCRIQEIGAEIGGADVPQAERNLYLVLLHELVHVKHCDNLWSFLAVLVLATQWYNPLIWLCFFALKRDIERRCDATVATISGDKKAYANVLLQTIQEKGAAL